MRIGISRCVFSTPDKYCELNGSTQHLHHSAPPGFECQGLEGSIVEVVRGFDEEGLRTPIEVGSRGKPLANQAVDAAIGTALPGFQQLSALCPPETADLPLIHRHLRHVENSDKVLRRPVETTVLIGRAENAP